MPKTPVVIAQGDCLEIMPKLKADSFDSVVSDPPYGLGFMGKQWDHGVPGVAFWTEAKRVLKPGAYMLVMGGSRTYHRLAVAVEDAGFEIRDCLMWIYGSGFPKAKSCLKPAYEPILLCRKSVGKVLPLSIDECRIPTTDKLGGGAEKTVAIDGKHEGWARPWMRDTESVEAHAARVRANVEQAESLGRWPANVLHDGSDEVMEAFAVSGESSPKPGRTGRRGGNGFGYFDDEKSAAASGVWPADSGGTAARFFYAAKASKSERGDDNSHPTVKPLALMEWLVKLVTPPSGMTLDPFAGSGTTGIACRNTGRNCVLIEREPVYCDIIRKRVFKGVK